MSDDRACGEHRRARHRQRPEAVDQALLDVLGQAERRDEPAERDRLDDDARHQEVDVVEAAAVDRAAEHVDEQQREHDRLDRVGDQQVGLARDPLEVAAREHDGVGHGQGERAHARASSGISSSVLGSTAAARPVSEMKTSSSVGRRSTMSSMPTSRAVEPPHGLGDHARVLLDRRAHDVVLVHGLLDAQLREGRDRPLGVGLVLERDLELLAADAGLELVGRALGDHRAVVDHDDLVGEAIGLVEVLGRQQHGRALLDAALDRLPQAEPRCAGPVRSSARRGTAPAGGRRARRPGRAAAACRRSRSSRGAAPASVRSKRSSSSSARVRASARGMW